MKQTWISVISRLHRLSADWLIVYSFTFRSRMSLIFTYNMETSPLPVKGCKIQAYARRSGPLSREGFLSCHTCCDTGPRFFRSHPKDHPIQSPLTKRKGMRRTYSNPDPHGGIYFNCTLLSHVHGLRIVLFQWENYMLCLLLCYELNSIRANLLISKGDSKIYCASGSADVESGI
jgi:hypothetical protein